MRTGNNIGIADFKKQIVTSVLNLKRKEKLQEKDTFLNILKRNQMQREDQPRGASDATFSCLTKLE